MLLKIALCADVKSVMEIGSFRGATALALVRNLKPNIRIITVDLDPRHGGLYRDGPFAARIERRDAHVERATFTNDAPGSVDLLFLDADHSYGAVKHDTEILLDLVSERGYFLWHDYANWGKFSGKNGVPEYLHELSNELPIARIVGTSLAVYSPAWRSGVGAETFQRALVQSDDVPGCDPWISEALRGW